jgi:hypothetical protein
MRAFGMSFDIIGFGFGFGFDLGTETRQGLIRQLEKFGLRPRWRRPDN